MKRILCLLLAAVMALTMLCGCENDKDAYVPTGNGLTGEDGVNPVAPQQQEQNQSLALIYYAEKTMNPYSCTDFTNRTLFSLLYQSLFVADRDSNVEPMLCKQYSRSRDMKTYVFYLEEATFSDDTVITDRDVAASLQAAKSSTVYGGRFTHITAIKALDDGGVQISLSTPMENLPLLLDIPILKEDQVKSDRPLGTGPYFLDETGISPVLRRRENWWCSAQLSVTANAVTLKKATDNAQIRDCFEFENLSLVCADPGSDKYADFRCDYELWDSENNIFLYLACNVNSKVFANDAVRSALPGTVDRNYIVENFYRGFARSATLPASPLSPYYSAALAKRYGYDGGAALKTALEKNYLNGSKITFLVNNDDSLRLRVAKQIMTVFTDAGLYVTLKAVSTADYEQALKWGSYDLYLGQTKLSPNMDLTPFFATKGSLNYGGFNDVSLYTMCLEALANYGNFYTLHQNVMNDGRLVPILVRSYAIYGERGTFTSLSPARDNIFYYSLGKTMDKAKIEE